jgi:type II secretory pathway component PulM
MSKLSDGTIECVSSAYLCLLVLPVGMTRLRLQTALSALRDELAHLKNESPEHVQADYEAQAAALLEADLVLRSGLA